MVSEDVNERDKEKRLQRLTRLAMDHLVDAAFWFGEDGRPVYVNRAACRSLGGTEETLLASTVDVFAPDLSAERWSDLWHRVTSVGATTFESAFRTGEGREFPVEIAASHLRCDGTDYCLAMVRDITHRKALDLGLRQSEKMEAVGRLASSVAHDFNDQLASIMGVVEILQDELKDPALFQYIERILISLDRAAALTAHLLAHANSRSVAETAERFEDILEEGMTEGDGDALPESNGADITLPSSAHVMIVDDDYYLRDVSTQTLIRMGCEVTPCENGQEALDIYRTSWRDIDVVILDIMMPVMNGKAAFIEMKRINPDIRAILASGYSLDNDVRAILAEGVFGYLHKPFRRAELIRMIDDVLRATRY